MPTSCLGAYSTSKAGIEAFSDVLRVEMKKWGVKVAIIEPAGFKTGTVCVTVSERLNGRAGWVREGGREGRRVGG